MVRKLLCSLSCSIALLGFSSAPEVETSPFQAMNYLFEEQLTHSNVDFSDYLYASRTWISADKLDENPIEVSHAYTTPINNAFSKVIGVDYEESVLSLATKIWLIDNAKHTIDLTYYMLNTTERVNLYWAHYVTRLSVVSMYGLWWTPWDQLIPFITQ
jgi:hypothetical protein